MVSARREGDTVIVFIPGWMSDSEESRWVDEMVRRLEVLEGIARGERALVEGRVVSHAQARRRLKRWLAPSR